MSRMFTWTCCALSLITVACGESPAKAPLAPSWPVATTAATATILKGRAVDAAPLPPANLTASVSGSTVTLAWSAAGDAISSYVLEAGSAPGLANLANSATGSTATSYVATGVGAGTYYVRVRAQNASGSSTASNEVTVVVGSAACTAAPNAPGTLTGSASGSTVTLSWSAPSGGCAATSYVLQAGTATGLSNLANSSTGSTSTSYVATGVGNGTYYVRVRAQNSAGQSIASNEVVITVGSTTTTTTPTTVDVQPRSFFNLGVIYSCRGGAILQDFTITAPPTVTWQIQPNGFTADALTGSGSRVVHITIAKSAQTLPGPSWYCADGDPVHYSNGFLVLFSGNNSNIFVDIGHYETAANLLLH